MAFRHIPRAFGLPFFSLSHSREEKTTQKCLTPSEKMGLRANGIAFL
jgi:hypothetical protein